MARGVLLTATPPAIRRQLTERMKSTDRGEFGKLNSYLDLLAAEGPMKTVQGSGAIVYNKYYRNTYKTQHHSVPRLQTAFLLYIRNHPRIHNTVFLNEQVTVITNLIHVNGRIWPVGGGCEYLWYLSFDYVVTW